MDTKCAGCEALEADVLDLHNRMQSMEHTCTRMKEGFVKNDLGLPDYDGHRTAHNAMITQSVLQIVVGVLAGMFSVGFWDWIGKHLK